MRDARALCYVTDLMQEWGERMASQAISGEGKGETKRKRRKESPDERAERLEERRIAQAEEERLAWAQRTQSALAQTDLSKLPARLGRPDIPFTEEQGELICTLLAQGVPLTRICETQPSLPHIATVWKWIRENPLFFADYVRAHESAADTWFSECLDIADDASQDVNPDGSPNSAAVARAKLRIDTRLRMIAKIAPKKYGEHMRPDAASLSITNNQLTVIDSRELDPAQRESLRQMLLLARGEG